MSQSLSKEDRIRELSAVKEQIERDADPDPESMSSLLSRNISDLIDAVQNPPPEGSVSFHHGLQLVQAQIIEIAGFRPVRHVMDARGLYQPLAEPYVDFLFYPYLPELSIRFAGELPRLLTPGQVDTLVQIVSNYVKLHSQPE